MDNTRRCPPGRRTQPKPRGDPHGRFDPTTRPLSLAGEPEPAATGRNPLAKVRRL
jgi:hypothetical protein